MRQELPTGTDILAELGQIALTAMGKASLPAFQQCLSDMVDFHRVLLEIHQSNSEPPTSYALLGGMRPPHVEWRLPYRLLYRHSLEHLVTTPEMFEELSHVPLRLLTPRVVQGPAEIAAGIVSLVGMSVYFLEDWQRQRRHLARTFDEPTLESRLGGAEAEALDNAVLTVVGSWEGLASIINRQDGGIAKEPEAWASLAARWPVVVEHLRVGAELVVRAAWNGDTSSFNRFLDAFRRWNGRFNASQSWRYSLRWPELLAEGGLRDRWENFAEDLPPDEGKRVRGLPPIIAYEIVRSNTHVQVSLIAAQLMAAWWLEGRADRFSLHASNYVLSAPDADEDDDEILERSTKAGQVFTRLFRHAIAAHLAATARKNHQYTAFLSGVVQALDNFTERKVVIGRGFTPSTKHDVFDLKAALFFLLALH